MPCNKTRIRLQEKRKYKHNKLDRAGEYQNGDRKQHPSRLNDHSHLNVKLQ